MKPSYCPVTELSQRRSQGRPGPLLPEEYRPRSFQAAFAMQQAVGEVFAGVSADRVAGWKCGTPSAGKNIIGPLYAETLQAGNVCQLYTNAGGLALVEPELAFELQQDLLPRAEPYAEKEVDAAVGVTRLALELIQSRYTDTSQASFFDALADGLVNQGLWLGPELKKSTELDLSAFTLSIRVGGEEKEALTAQHPNGNPRAGLYWLVNFLSQQGIALRRGQQVITGSYSGVLKLPVEQLVTLGYGKLGEFTLQFSEIASPAA